MKVIEGELHPGEKPKRKPGTEPIVLSSFSLYLSADGRVVVYSHNPAVAPNDFMNPNHSLRTEFQIMSGKKQVWKGKEFTITVERAPSDVTNLSQARRRKGEVKP